ncbi:uncharacterized protein [Elaeis guineensis]|uniref:Uncharacterized protein LOC105049422 n=1 Tax=Elaeis guineensis var. tenera TaxID=51953 RepID=A0A6I9RIM0_ELAGV|nr:uncharacterized protein LOC105049422 [Elaeis guineensis]
MSYENYDPCFPDQPVVDRYLPLWAKQPSFRYKPAFVWAEDSPRGMAWASITYTELSSSVEDIASRLLHPLQRGDTLLILCSPGLQLVKLLFAAQRAGLVAIPIIPPDPSSFSPAKQGPAHHHLLRALSQANPKAAIAHSSYISAVTRSISPSTSDRLARLLHKLQWIPVDDLEDENQNSCCPNSDTSEYLGCGPTDTYLIQYTSGATGIPKPVLVTAGAAAHNVRVARKAYDLQPSSVIVSWLPQYHDCGLMFLLLTVVSGATCVLTSPGAFLHRPRLWLELITEFKATCTPVPSFTLPLVVKRGGIDQGTLRLKLGSMRNLILINEPIYKSSVDEFVDEFARVGLNPSSISPSYGLAENGTFVSTAWQCQGEEGCRYPNMPSYNKLLPSARLSSPSSSSSYEEEEMDIIVVNQETCEPVEDGVEGEIWVSSPSNAAGYLGHPSLTHEVFHGRLPGRAGKCYVRTGDRGIVKGDERYLYVVGRTVDVIRMHDGRNSVHAHYIETAVHNSSPKYLRGGCVAAFEMASPMPSKRMVVAVVAELQTKEEGGRVGTYRRIGEAIREGVLKEEGVRVGWVVLVESGSVPKTTSGKLRRWLAKNKLLEGRFPVVCEVCFEEYSSAVEERGEKDGVGSGEVGEGMRDAVLVRALGTAGRRFSLISFL